MKPEDGPMIAHMDELWHKLLEVTRQRDQLLAAIALHKLVVSQAGDDGEAQLAADMRLWSDAIGVLEEDQ
jgi:hypothetical protein